MTKIDPHLLNGARQLGFGDDYSAKLNDVGLLETTMSRVLDESRALTRAAGVAAKSPEKAPDTIELDADLYDEDTIGKLKAQNSLVEKQSETINALRKENMQAEVQRTQQEFNQFLSRIGPGWEPVFGKGQVKEGSAAYANRLLLLDKSLEQGLGLEAAGKNSELSVVFDQGLRMAFPDHQTKLATDKLSAQVKSRSKQILSKPGATPKKVELSPTKAAEAGVAKWAKENGIALGSDTDDDDEWGS